MLPKTQRLASNRIEHILKKGKTTAQHRQAGGSGKNGKSCFIIKYLPNRQTKSRFCVIVSIKVLPKAVERNRLRRQIFEILRTHPELPRSPTDIVIIANIHITKLNFKDLTTTILQTLQNITPTS